MKRVANAEHQTIVEIPAILGMGIVIRVEPELGTIAVEVEHVPIAVRSTIVQKAIHDTSLRIVLGMNLTRHRNALALCTKYFHFLSPS